MAKRRLKERPCAVNPPSPASTVPSLLSQETSAEFLEFVDEIMDGIGKAQSMIAVSQFGGLENCEVNIQHKYLALLDDILQKTRQEVKHLYEWYREKI